jgi:hypothetical protein
MPRVAALLDVQQISDITNIESEDTFVRPIYAGNAILTVQTADSPKVITVRGTAFPSGAAEGGSASVEEGVDSKAACPTEWISEDLATSDRPDLATAEKVVSSPRKSLTASCLRLLMLLVLPSVLPVLLSTAGSQTTVCRLVRLERTSLLNFTSVLVSVALFSIWLV